MIYEYTFGVFVRADSEEAAWALVRPISEALDKLDIEGESATQLEAATTEEESK